VPAARIGRWVIQLEARLKAAHPEIVTIFIKPQTESTYREVVRRRYG
jgi:hypothetical protein